MGDDARIPLSDTRQHRVPAGDYRPPATIYTLAQASTEEQVRLVQDFLATAAANGVLEGGRLLAPVVEVCLLADGSALARLDTSVFEAAGENVFDAIAISPTREHCDWVDWADYSDA
jgi:hypothetical protein